MDLRSIYIPNGIGIFILLMLLYCARTRVLRHRTEDRLFTFMIVGVILGCVIEAFSYSVDGKLFPGARFLNYIANTYLYSVNLLLPFSVLVYIDLGLFDDPGRIWKRYKLQILIGCVMLAINIVNFFVPVSYYITELNVYERRPISYVYYFVILYYLVTAIVITRRYEKENGAKAFFSIDMFLVPILVGSGLQFLFYGLSLAWLSSAVGLVGLFMMQQNEMAYVDYLTGAYNRQYLNHILSAWTDRGNSFAGAMLDVDSFKQINDCFGHSEGDNALKTVVSILKRARSDNEWVFRFAGDEFVVLKMAGDTESLEAYLGRVRKMLDEHNSKAALYRIELSYGLSLFRNVSVNDFMKDMDEKMYEMKAEHHRDR